MKKRKRTPKESKDLGSTTQTAGVWVNVKDSLPPFYKIVTVKTKSGTISDDCARIPDGDNDFYIQGLGILITDIVEWMIPESL
jgi:hypothetical protein